MTNAGQRSGLARQPLRQVIALGAHHPMLSTKELERDRCTVKDVTSVPDRSHRTLADWIHEQVFACDEIALGISVRHQVAGRTVRIAG